MPRYIIDWKLEGTFEVEAASADDAQAKFDAAWNSPKGILPTRDGELWTDTPGRLQD